MSETRQRLATLFSQQHRTMIRRLRRLGAAATAAEDIVQEAYLRLLAQPEPPREPRAYLYRTAHNLLIDAARRDSRCGEVLLDVAEADEPTSDSIGGEAAYIEHETTEQLHSALADLPESLRQALADRLEGRTLAQVAAAGSTTVKTAFDRVGRAVALLRTGLEPERSADPQWRTRLTGQCPMHAQRSEGQVTSL